MSNIESRKRIARPSLKGEAADKNIEISDTARIVAHYLESQRLCEEFDIPKHHGECVALLFLIDLLANANPALTVTEASLILNLPGATTARKLRELAAINLVQVLQDTTDKRRFNPRLTDHGTKFIEAYKNITPFMLNLQSEVDSLGTMASFRGRRAAEAALRSALHRKPRTT